MSDAWSSYPDAPAPGTRLCPLLDVPDGGSYSINLGEFGIILVRRGRQVWAYVNACPHQFLPLDWRSEKVISSDGDYLLCSNHDAKFELESGRGVAGFGQGCELDDVPVKIIEGEVVIAQR